MSPGAPYLPFAFAASGPAAGALSACHKALLSLPDYCALAAHAGSPQGPGIRALIREQPSPVQGLTLKRLYVSFQEGGAGEGTPFRAQTFLYRFAADRLTHWAFPDDPRLPTLRPLLAPWRSCEVIRYVPLKRLTLRLGDGPVTGTVIGKAGAGLDARALAERQSAISTAARAAGAKFRVARPYAATVSAGLALQELLPGKELAKSLTPSTLCEGLAAAGSIHAAIHGLALSCTRSWTLGTYQDLLAKRIDWIRWLRPDLASFLDTLHADLGAAAETLPRDEQVFCHGDFRCTQLLFDSVSCEWGAVDFDDCVAGDRHHEVGKFLALLAYDMPWLHRESIDKSLLPAAENAYLEAYADASGYRLDPRAIEWHRTAGELFLLARLLKRDLFDPASFDATVEGIALRWHIDPPRTSIV